MNLRKYLTITTGLAFLVSFITFTIIASSLLRNGFTVIENDAAIKNTERVQNAFAQMNEELHGDSIDWANWDDTYQFIQDRNPAYIESNIGDQSLTDARLDMILFLDQKFVEAAHNSVRRMDDLAPPVPAEVIAAMGGPARLSTLPVNGDGEAGVVSINGHPMAYSLRPIRPSKLDKSSRGWILFARYFGSEENEILERITRQNLTLSVGGSVPSNILKGPNPDIAVETLDHDLKRGFVQVRDNQGESLMVLSFDIPRTITKHGEAVAKALAVGFGIIAFLFAGTCVLLIEKVAVSRIYQLGQQLDSINDFEAIHEIEMGGKDEISSLANRINKMLRKLYEDGVTLHENRSALSQHNESLEQTILERTREIEHQALHDRLTGLPNRDVFLHRLALNLEKIEVSGKGAAVLFIDLDGFKLVNDTLGHDQGDLLLVKVAQVLRTCIRPGDTIARFGGDEFALLLEDLTDIAEAEAVGKMVVSELVKPIQLDSQQVVAGASVGIAFASQTGVHAEDLLKNADIAMYRVKSDGKSNYMVFEESMREVVEDRLALEVDLRRALEEGQMRVAYQPLVDMASKRLIGAEALLRWEHPTRGLVPPSQFIPIAESIGLIYPLGTWVLEQACRQAASWIEEYGSHDFSMNVNISGKQLQRADVLSMVSQVLERTGLPPHNLTLEITESVLVDHGDVVTTLVSLKALGIRLALDDFGTGYSTLSTLRNFPIDKLKIDREFISRLNADDDSMAIVRAIIGLAGSMNMSSTGEGIETTEQSSILQQLGCHIGQGYLFNKPLSPEEFREEFEQERQDRAA